MHIAHNGIFGKPVLKKGTKNSWTVEVETTLENSDYARNTAAVRASVYDGETLVASHTEENIAVDGDTQRTILQKLSVSRPERWDVDNPKLYTLTVEVLKNGECVDSETTRIGFRTFSIDAEKGFFLNGRPLKIKGTCNHQDHAGVGVGVPDSVQYYRIKRLKEMGTNAYRCAHNLPAKEILDACDEIGLIVMDENRRFESRTEVLEYLDIMVKRDRNHPSVIFWSLFNEEPLQNTEEGAKIFRRMKSRVLKLDDSRLLVGAMNGSSMEGAGLEMDVTGINYSLKVIDQLHALHPDHPIIGSENNSAVTTRGCYLSDKEGAQILSNYDEETVKWGQLVRETWDFTRKRDYFAGIFIWTGFDYRGEPTPFTWPSVSSQFGIMDTCGFAKDSFYFNKACFTEKPMVHILPHWTHKKGDVVRVMAVSNCEEVELFLNGRSLGRKPSDVCETAEWQVEYTPGRISAKAYRNGKCVAKDEQRTAGKPYAIRLMPDADTIVNDGADTAIVNVAVVDKKGIVVPYADDLIRFEIEGEGYVRGVGNGDPNSHELDNVPYRRAYCGLCQALVTAKLGARALRVRAVSEGLEEASFAFEIKDVPAPLCPKNITNYILDGFTMSEVMEEKPDATAEIADNDMNSYTPIQFVKDVFQSDFRNGWRIYRTKPKAIKDGEYRLDFMRVRFADGEIYVNGVLVDRIEEPVRGAYVSKPFAVKAGETLDIRILLHVVNERFPAAGISGRVEMKETK
jgi:beta-galactosidase